MSELIRNIEIKWTFTVLASIWISLYNLQGQNDLETNDKSFVPSISLPGPHDPFEIKADLIDSLLDIPNVFYPSGTGDAEKYNRFTISSDTDDPIYIQIFTRAGALVYKERGPTVSWNGRNSSGHELSSGVYYYIIEYEVQPATLTKTGFVYLFRDGDN